jgi:hypothetical protein
MESINTAVLIWLSIYFHTVILYYKYNGLDIQGIHKRMVRFQKLIKNLFLTLHEHNIHRKLRQLSKFLMR